MEPGGVDILCRTRKCSLARNGPGPGKPRRCTASPARPPILARAAGRRHGTSREAGRLFRPCSRRAGGRGGRWSFDPRYGKSHIGKTAEWRGDSTESNEASPVPRPLGFHPRSVLSRLHEVSLACKGSISQEKFECLLRYQSSIRHTPLDTEHDPPTPLAPPKTTR